MLRVIVLYCVRQLRDPVGDPAEVRRRRGRPVRHDPFLSLVFWAWVLGPLGALLAVPLTLLAKALLVEADPRAHGGCCRCCSASEHRTISLAPSRRPGVPPPNLNGS